MYIEYILQALPVVLAVIAAVKCAIHYTSIRRAQDRRVVGLAIISSLLLVIAQTSWFVSSVIQHDLEGTWFAAWIWNIFNTLTMAIFILLASRRDGCGKTSCRKVPE